MSQSEKHLLDQLRQLVGTPSVSSTDPAWDQGNRKVIELLANWLEPMGFHVEIQNVTADGEKANLIATLGNGPGGLVLAGHTDTVPFDEAPHLEHLVLEPVLDRGHLHGRRGIARELEHAAKKDRHVREARAGALLDRRDQAMDEVGVRAAEVVQELDFHRLHGAHHFSA